MSNSRKEKGREKREEPVGERPLQTWVLAGKCGKGGRSQSRGASKLARGAHFLN